MNPGPLSASPFFAPAKAMNQAAKSAGKVVETMFKFDRTSYSKYVTNLIGLSVVLYLFLYTVGTNAGFFSNGLMTSVRDLSLNILAFLIIAWGVLHRNANPMTALGYTALAGVGYLVLANLPLSASVPNWISRAKTATVNLAEGATQGGLVATAFTLL